MTKLQFRVGALAEFIILVRGAMVLDVMHEFMTSEGIGPAHWLMSYWQTCVQENQSRLEDFFRIMKLVDDEQPTAWDVWSTHLANADPEGKTNRGGVVGE